jgi:hypothetical protein
MLCSANEWRAGLRRAKNYPHALAECRAANAAFAQKVIARIGRYL